MAYIVNQDVIDRVGTAVAAQLSAETGSTVDAAVITVVVNKAEGEVNEQLARLYATPIDVTADATWPDFMKGLALPLAVYHLMARRPDVPATYVRDHDEVIARLKALATGEAKFPGAVTPASTTSDKPVATWGGETPNANRADMV